jgi:ABC-type Fe3+/spermidine/putrescine transport system ATPase subunit
LYESPGTAFVAEFIGRTNLVAGEADGSLRVATGAGVLVVGQEGARGRVMVSVRPERIRFANRGGARGVKAENRLTGRLVESSFLGESSEHVVEVGGVQLRLIATPPRMDVKGQVEIEFAAADAVVLPR